MFASAGCRAHPGLDDLPGWCRSDCRLPVIFLARIAISISSGSTTSAGPSAANIPVCHRLPTARRTPGLDRRCTDFSQTGMSILDMAAFFSKWMQDRRDTHSRTAKSAILPRIASPKPRLLELAGMGRRRRAYPVARLSQLWRSPKSSGSICRNAKIYR